MEGSKPPARARWRPSRRLIVRLAVLVAVAAAAVGLYSGLRATGILFVDKLPVRFALPEPTGALPIGVTELHLVDRSRMDPWIARQPRELMVSIWYPAQPAAGYQLAPYMLPAAARHFAEAVLGPLRLANRVDIGSVRTHAWSNAPVAAAREAWPVILFSPGGSIPRPLGTVLVEELASRGYVVVTMDHTYEATAVEFPDGRVALRSLPEAEDLLRRLVAVRVDDVRFVLSQLEAMRAGGNPDAASRPLPEGLRTALDLSRVGMFGHSAGGFTAAETMLVDARIDAGVNLDGSMAYRMSRGEYGAAVGRGLERPFMLMGAGASGGPTRPHTHHWSPPWKVFWENSTGWKLDLYMPEGEHFSFTDYQVIAPQLAAKTFLPDMVVSRVLGTVDPQRAVASTRAYLVAFFDQHLKGVDQPLLQGPSPHHPDIDFIR